MARDDGQVEATLIAFATVALFPRTAVIFSAPGRFGPRGVALWVFGWTLFLFSMRQWIVPAARRQIAADEREREQLRRELGREPSADEFHERRTASRRSRCASGTEDVAD